MKEAEKAGDLIVCIRAYKNMLARGYSREEALEVSEIPEEVADKIEM